ncbi:MAG: cupredoxin domain-containing protein [Patescibacteria group bacterium]|nr:cupredoxin domain-containing protein [Patescibacteria group bacterium]
MNKFFLKNTKGSQKTIMIALLAVAIILVVLVAISLFKKPVVDKPITNLNNGAPAEVVDNMVGDLEPNTPVADPVDAFRAEVPVNTVVPGVDTQLSEEEKKEIALPGIVVPAAPGSNNSFRNFKISIENDVFSPSKAIVNVGDTVHIDFTAVDKAYDLSFPSYNMKSTFVQGQTRIMEFKAKKEGSFTFYCPSCGGPEAGPVGNIIIVAK